MVLKLCSTKPHTSHAAWRPEQSPRGAEKAQSPAPAPTRAPPPYFCFRDPSLLREKLSGLKQL